MKKFVFVFDLDSTVISIESLNHLIKSKITDVSTQRKIDKIANAALNNEIDYHECMFQRFYTAQLHEEDFAKEGELSVEHINPGMRELFAWLKNNKYAIYIVSGGFLPVVKAVGKALDVQVTHLYANTFTEKEDGTLELDDGVLTYSDGKIKVINDIRKTYKEDVIITMIGDGTSDLCTWTKNSKKPVANYFVGCGINVQRPNVKKNCEMYALNTKEMQKYFIEIIKSES
ncbi:MAG: HAD-IB family phosphatase [Mycoplasmataceae bacterium]|jgi:HAD superfamily phosphoserine phosphatase-like hydrolase|nr:HAD-IB family phosphatase [Mycoplasmataceae bacterium]